VAAADSVWIPLVDEPIGRIVEELETGRPEIKRLVSSPQHLLAFRTFAYIRVGILLGQLLVDEDIGPYDGTENWVEQLLSDPRHRAAVEREVEAVAKEVAADPRYADEEAQNERDQARERFRTFARAHSEQQP
jgi:hypothetical protein